MPKPEELKRALKAFKKRLKLTRLDDESNYGGNKLTGGRNFQHEIQADLLALAELHVLGCLRFETSQSSAQSVTTRLQAGKLVTSRFVC